MNNAEAKICSIMRPVRQQAEIAQLHIHLTVLTNQLISQGLNLWNVTTPQAGKEYLPALVVEALNNLLIKNQGLVSLQDKVSTLSRLSVRTDLSDKGLTLTIFDPPNYPGHNYECKLSPGTPVFEVLEPIVIALLNPGLTTSFTQGIVMLYFDVNLDWSE